MASYDEDDVEGHARHATSVLKVIEDRKSQVVVQVEAG